MLKDSFFSIGKCNDSFTVVALINRIFLRLRQADLNHRLFDDSDDDSMIRRWNNSVSLN